MRRCWRRSGLHRDCIFGHGPLGDGPKVMATTRMASMEWYVALHREPVRRPAKSSWQYRGRAVESLVINGGDLVAPLPVTFEQAVATLESWDCMLVEPDGSVVWASPQWRIDAQLQDGRDGLQYVELRTTAPQRPNRRLAAAFCSEGHQLVVQLIQEGVFLTLENWLSLLTPDAQ